MTYDKPSKSILYCSGAVLTLVFLKFAYAEFYDESFNSLYWIILIFGVVFLFGQFVWYALELDKDTKWQDKLDQLESENEKVVKANSVKSLNDLLNQQDCRNAEKSKPLVVTHNIPTLPRLPGYDVPYWLAAYPVITIYLLFSLSQPAMEYLLGLGHSLGPVLPLVATSLTLVAARDCKNHIKVNFQKSKSSFDGGGTAFYQFMTFQAEKLGLEKIGDYEQAAYQRTIFGTLARDCIVEVGVRNSTFGVSIKTLTADGRLYETTSIIDCRWRSNTELAWLKAKSLAEAMKEHANRLIELASEDTVKVCRWNDKTLDLAHNHRWFRQMYEADNARWDQLEASAAS